MVGMRPIGAPDYAFGCVIGQRAGERHRVGIRIFLFGDSVGPGQFHPDIATIEKPAQRRECRAVQPFGDVNAADMIDDDRRVDGGDEVVVLDHPLPPRCMATCQPYGATAAMILRMSSRGIGAPRWAK